MSIYVAVQRYDMWITVQISLNIVNWFVSLFYGFHSLPPKENFSQPL